MKLRARLYLSNGTERMMIAGAASLVRRDARVMPGNTALIERLSQKHPFWYSRETMGTRDALIEVYEKYLLDFGDTYSAESFVDFVTVALVDTGKLDVGRPHDARSLVRWFREHADRLEKAIPKDWPAPKVDTIDNASGVTCDRCKAKPVDLRITYPPPADWHRLLCLGCWDATKDRDPMAMIREGDGTV